MPDRHEFHPGGEPFSPQVIIAEFVALFPDDRYIGAIGERFSDVALAPATNVATVARNPALPDSARASETIVAFRNPDTPDERIIVYIMEVTGPAGLSSIRHVSLTWLQPTELQRVTCMIRERRPDGVTRRSEHFADELNRPGSYYYLLAAINNGSYDPPRQPWSTDITGKTEIDQRIPDAITKIIRLGPVDPNYATVFAQLADARLHRYLDEFSGPR